ncbi:MAG: Trm112 family protein [SAR324 cluster bacterium]|nr:Trm112 family protein [SAR324 cluster bacterium]
MSIEQNILDLLCCPACKHELKQEAETLICEPCKLSYPVTSGMPCLLVEEATKL